MHMNTQSNIQNIETNDCTVKAIQNAFSISYEDAHLICKGYGRKDGQGFFVNELMFNLSQLGKIKPLFFTPKFRTTRAILSGGSIVFHANILNERWAAFKKRLDVNKTYIVIVSGHAFCYKNGNEVDVLDNSGRKVERCYERII